MERNANDTFGATNEPGASTGVGGSGSFGNTGATTGTGAGTTGTAGTAGTTGTSTGYGATGAGEVGTGGTGTQTGRTENTKQAVQEKLGQVKERARELQSTLADKLDAQADKLRQRNQNASFATATSAGTGTADIASDDRMAHMQDSVARGLTKSADWLRNGDLRADIERQVRDNPGRTLLIALGVGYVLGKAFRSNR